MELFELLKYYQSHPSVIRLSEKLSENGKEKLGIRGLTGSSAWQNLKNRTKSKVKDIARELISLYAKRKMGNGFAYLHEAARKAGFPGVLVAGCGGGIADNGFQVQTIYNTKPGTGLNLTDIYPFKLLADYNISVWKRTDRPNMPYIPCATAGWDRRPWEAVNGEGFGSGVAVSAHFDRGTPAEPEQYIRSMAEWMDANPDKITKDYLGLIYAWNEIGEGGWLVPCKDDPDGEYLKAIRNALVNEQ